MQVSRDNIILIISVLAFTFLIIGVFFLSYITLYNQRKKKNYLQKIAMQKEFEQELVKTQMEVQEHTLKTIASDIHDNVGQLLSITKLTLSSISTTRLDEKNTKKLNDAQEMLDNASLELRQMASLLHAENLLAKGLSNALEREINWLLKSEHMQIRYSVAGESFKRLSKQKELVAYRITQELLNNTIKHAGATELVIKLSFDELATVIFIADNGKGFSVEKVRDKSEGLGMNTLFHRAELIGAELKLHSEEGKGTTAILHIPYLEKRNS